MSDSTTYETTYSQDERIDECLKKTQRKVQDEEKELDEHREEEFRNYYESQKDDEDFVFRLKGIKFLKFTHVKIKFTFEPRQVVEHVSRKVMFYCTLRYRKDHWVMKRNSIPVNYRMRIHQLFYSKQGFRVNDDNVVPTLVKIYDVLVEWSRNEEKFRLKKFADYKEGVDVYLDSDDEEIFLNETEKRRLHRKRDRILERMLAPPSERFRLIYD